MRIGIIGLPQVGKKALFEILTNHKPSEKEVASNRPIKGVAEIKDPRLDKLILFYKPKKMTRARIDIELLPKLEKDVIAKADIFADINELDAICHVVRAFKDDSIYHVSGSVDPKRDIDSINSELMLYDMIFMEKRLERLEHKIKQIKEDAAIKEKELLLKLKTHLDKGLPLRLLELTPDEKRSVSGYPLVTRKEMIVVLNVSEDSLKDTALAEALKNEYRASRIEVAQLSAKVEDEIAGLESEDEKAEFLKALGIAEPALALLARLCLKALNMISFFTAGEEDARQWLVRTGSTAPEAASVIHSDIERGFIRAEVMKFNDLVELGSEDKVRHAGRLYVKGKDYIVEDGDIINIRFSV